MIEEALLDAEDRMEKSLSATQSELAKVRTGRANPALLETVKVEYYGSTVPLKQVANVGVPEPRLILVQPWDKSILADVEKAILKADIGITPNNDGHVIRLPIPALTEDTRKDLVKLLHQLGEEGKIAIRNIRRDILDHLKKARKNSEISEDEEFNAGIDIQEMTDKFTGKIDEAIKTKEKDVMEV